MHAERRLYVDGGTATNVSNLFQGSEVPLIPPGQDRDTWYRPGTKATDLTLDRYTVHPTRTARTYCCFVENSGNGDVVVTVLVRAEMVGDTLWVEGRSQVLLPVQSGFKDVYWVNKLNNEVTLPVLRGRAPPDDRAVAREPAAAHPPVARRLAGRRGTCARRVCASSATSPSTTAASSSLREDASLPSDPASTAPWTR